MTPAGTARRASCVACGVGLAAMVACGDRGTAPQNTRIEAPSELSLSSTAFQRGQMIPTEYTCDGRDVSPSLRWRRAQVGDEYVLTMVDPDAPGGAFVHWVVFGIRSTSVPREGPAEGALEGTNSSQDVGYAGPCPPEGDEPHRYVFTVYAVSGGTEDLEEGDSLDEVLSAIECCVEARGSLTGRYGR